FLAGSGVASRRRCDEIIRSGRVKINGVIEVNPARRIDPEIDVVELNEKRVKPSGELHYILLNKPAGTISSVSDNFGRRTVLDLLPFKFRLCPVGRLDAGTTGALILTDDGELAYRLTHPKFNIKKVYLARINGEITDAELELIKRGIKLEDCIARVHNVEVLHREDNCSELRLTLTEGKKREIKRIFNFLGYNVKRLHRESFADISCGSLKPGEWRELSEEEIKKLKKM
ncbi:MAG: pseudouridine synthase, partial [Fidelibacterota bacterium]